MRRGYALIDVIISIFCIMILSLPIIKSLDIINIDRQKYLSDKALLEAIDKSKEYVEDSSSVLNEDVDMGEYMAKIIVDKKIDDDVYKYKVSISEKEDDRIKSEYYIIKRYE